MKANISPLTKLIKLTVDNSYVQQQIKDAIKHHESSLQEVLDNKETWESGVGSYTTLRAKEGSNEIAGTIYLSQAIIWEDL